LVATASTPGGHIGSATIVTDGGDTVTINTELYDQFGGDEYSILQLAPVLG
jgi:hypothetical protein